MKNIASFTIFCIAIMTVAFLFGRGCKPKPEREVKTVVVGNPEYDREVAEAKRQVQELEVELGVMKVAKAKVRIKYVERKVLYNKVVQDTMVSEAERLKIAEEIMADCDTLLLDSERQIEKLEMVSSIQKTVIYKDSVEMVKTKIILGGVQKNYERELSRKKFWRGVSLGTVAAIIGIRILQ